MPKEKLGDRASPITYVRTTMRLGDNMTNYYFLDLNVKIKGLLSQHLVVFF